MEKNQKFRKITLYYSLLAYLGMASAVFGPSLLKLVEQTNSSLSQMSYLFSGRAISYLAGSWLAGILFDKYKGHQLLIGGLTVLGLSLGLIPFMGDPLGLILLVMGMAVATALVDVGCNSLLFRIPDIKVGPAMNGLHFFFGLGSFLAPLLLVGSLQINNGIQLGYWGLGLFSLLILIQFVGLKEPSSPIKDTPEPAKDKLNQGLNRNLLIWVIILFFFAFVGVEVGYGDWLSTYSIQTGLAAETTAVLLTSTYWGAFTISRLISIPLAIKIKPKYLLTADVLGALIGLGLVFLFPEQSALLWVGTIILGFSIASLFPLMLTFAETMMPMTGKITSRFFIGGSIGSIFLPWVIGRTVETIGPLVIIRILFLTLVLAGVIFLILLRVSKKHPRSLPRV